VIVLGLTFKENCADLRNSKVIDVIRELESYGVTVHVHDPVAAADDAQHEYGVRLVEWDHLPRANAIVAAVAHDALREHSLDELTQKLCAGGLVADVKGMFDAGQLRAGGFHVWRL
jgi:UDP-N-acetyl-D-glucosamine/UDP-N-acetyl-D-galactosamine dehydrogenase